MAAARPAKRREVNFMVMGGGRKRLMDAVSIYYETRKEQRN